MSLLNIFVGRGRGRVVLERQWNPVMRMDQKNVDIGAFPDVPQFGIEIIATRDDITNISIIPWKDLFIYNEDTNYKFLLLSCKEGYIFSNNERDGFALVPCLIEMEDGSKILGFKNCGRTYYFRPPYESQPRTEFDTINPRGKITLKDMGNEEKAYKISPFVRKLCFIQFSEQTILLVEACRMDIPPSTYPTYRVINF